MYGTRRQATSSSSPYGIFPGTYCWCGLGNSAPDKARLGISPFVDRCCRIHDQCPLWILKLESRYGLFNSRFHTVSHCHCDEAFRNCLQMEGSETGNYVNSILKSNSNVMDKLGQNSSERVLESLVSLRPVTIESILTEESAKESTDNTIMPNNLPENVETKERLLEPSTADDNENQA
ncbi:PLA2G [Lepeophtheirus salmonis]|uniref:PLA2G n=1 Tax=Lepeophtheirus salmonis TaxID=72036 RepID=A0A7R8H040_LEPSM|nr:PLA2G [Lepeophtheirus salmonis]CAF2762759.1 PLA2G [Lepeophtheirus salmonis]